MRNIKRIISSFLVLLVCVGLFPLSALADAPYEGDHTGTIRVTVKDAASNTGMAGASVMLEDITAGREHNYGTQTTGDDGRASWNGLSSGWYRITQTYVTEGYILNSEEIIRYFDTEQHAVLDLTVTNRSQTALHIYRIDPATQKGLAGASYIVADNTGAEVAKGQTNEDGYFIVPHLEAGDYTITEVKAPNGYTLTTPNAKKVTVVETGGDPYIAIFTGSEKSSITIFNYDSATGAPIPGSKWKIERIGGGFSVDSLVTNTSGLVTQSGLEPGSYLVTELAVSSGYIKELKHAEVVIGQQTENKVVSLSNMKPGMITIYAGDSVTGKALAGCSFSLYDERNQVIAGPAASNNDGFVTFENVSDGHYTVSAAPAPGYVMDIASQPVTIEQGGDRRIVFTATPLGGILIRAIDEVQPAKMLPSCSFEVREMDGTLAGTFTTGLDGTAQVSGLDNGYYVIQETKVPDGYVMESATKTVFVQAGAVTTVTFSHRDKPYIVVQCFIKGTTSPVPGSVVHLYNDNGVSIRSGTAGEDGSCCFEDLEPGVYTIKYASAPSGYTIDTPDQTVAVTRAKAGLATLYASRHASIVITKLDGETKEPLAGAVFLIRDSLGAAQETVTTDVTGTAVTKALTPGRYTIHEQFAPDGYVPATTTRSVEVRNNEASLATFTNQKKTAVVVYAYDEDGIPMANISYILHDATTGKEVASKLTGAAGTAVFEQLEPGIYMVSEPVVPEGYIVVNPTQSRISVSAGAASYVRFVHVPQATIKMETADIYTGKAAAGAVYQIAREDGSFIGNYTAGSDGGVSTGALPLGKYFVKQVTAPEGYLLNTTTQTITVQRDRVNLAKFFNKPLSRICVECVVSGENFGLGGVTVTVEDEAGKEVSRGTTPGGGLFTTGELAPGNYTVKVISTPGGYACVQKQRTVQVTIDTPTSVKFEFTAHNRIIINLTDASDPSKGLSSSTFRVEAINGDFQTDLVTDAAGHAMTSSLPDGTYMVHQTSAPDGYILDQSYQWATLDASANTVLDFTNRRNSGLVIQALTETEHKGLSGAVFEIWEQNGKLIQTATTDSSGIIQTGNLAPGVYLVKEVAVPSGYTARTLTQTVTIDYEQSSTLNFYHTAESGLTVNKTDAKTGKPLAGAVFRITKADGDYVGDYTTNASGKVIVDALEAGRYNITETKAPAGYVLDPTSRSFVIKDNQPVVLDLTNEPVSGLRIINTCKQDGKPIRGSVFRITTYAGDLVGVYTTNSAGHINASLGSGSYTIYQTSVADGYIKNTDVWNLTITDGEDKTLEVLNERLSHIVVHMVDAVTGDGIYGVEMEIKDESGNYIGRFRSNNEGSLFLTDVLEEGRYTLTLFSVPSGYDKDSIPKTIVVKTGKTAEVTWELQGHRGQVTIVTYSGSDNAMMNIRKNAILSGAVYQITDTSGKAVGTIAGDRNGAAYSGALALGTYYIQQIAAPSGWQINTTRFSVNVTDENDNIRVEVYNLAANYQTTVSVNGQASALAGGAVKYYFTLANKSTSTMSNFFLHIKVPTDIMRAETFYTGTFSGSAAAYYLEYKTNLRDYRTLASGLNSKSNYSYGLSTQALGLQSGEYVTDIRMVFTAAVPGFQQRMAPTLSCYVLSTAITGHQGIMRAECGAMNGYYGNNSSGGVWGSTTGQTLIENPGTAVDNGWVSSAGQFSTFICGNGILPGRLPKTGY